VQTLIRLIFLKYGSNIVIVQIVCANAKEFATFGRSEFTALLTSYVAKTPISGFAELPSSLSQRTAQGVLESCQLACGLLANPRIVKSLTDKDKK
jgi:hypothetical protein